MINSAHGSRSLSPSQQNANRKKLGQMAMECRENEDRLPRLLECESNEILKLDTILSQEEISDKAAQKMNEKNSPRHSPQRSKPDPRLSFGTFQRYPPKTLPKSSIIGLRALARAFDRALPLSKLLGEESPHTHHQCQRNKTDSNVQTVDREVDNKDIDKTVKILDNNNQKIQTETNKHQESGKYQEVIKQQDMNKHQEMNRHQEVNKHQEKNKNLEINKHQDINKSNKPQRSPNRHQQLHSMNKEDKRDRDKTNKKTEPNEQKNEIEDSNDEIEVFCISRKSSPMQIGKNTKGSKLEPKISTTDFVNTILLNPPEGMLQSFHNLKHILPKKKPKTTNDCGNHSPKQQNPDYLAIETIFKNKFGDHDDEDTSDSFTPQTEGSNLNNFSYNKDSRTIQTEKTNKGKKKQAKKVISCRRSSPSSEKIKKKSLSTGTTKKTNDKTTTVSLKSTSKSAYSQSDSSIEKKYKKSPKMCDLKRLSESSLSSKNTVKQGKRTRNTNTNNKKHIKSNKCETLTHNFNAGDKTSNTEDEQYLGQKEVFVDEPYFQPIKLQNKNILQKDVRSSSLDNYNKVKTSEASSSISQTSSLQKLRKRIIKTGAKGFRNQNSYRLSSGGAQETKLSLNKRQDLSESQSTRQCDKKFRQPRTYYFMEAADLEKKPPTIDLAQCYEENSECSSDNASQNGCNKKLDLVTTKCKVKNRNFKKTSASDESNECFETNQQTKNHQQTDRNKYCETDDSRSQCSEDQCCSRCNDGNPHSSRNDNSVRNDRCRKYDHSARNNHFEGNDHYEENNHSPTNNCSPRNNHILKNVHPTGNNLSQRINSSPRKDHSAENDRSPRSDHAATNNTPRKNKPNLKNNHFTWNTDRFQHNSSCKSSNYCKNKKYTKHDPCTKQQLSRKKPKKLITLYHNLDSEKTDLSSSISSTSAHFDGEDNVEIIRGSRKKRQQYYHKSKINHVHVSVSQKIQPNLKLAHDVYYPKTKGNVTKTCTKEVRKIKQSCNKKESELGRAQALMKQYIEITKEDKVIGDFNCRHKKTRDESSKKPIEIKTQEDNAKGDYEMKIKQAEYKRIKQCNDTKNKDVQCTSADLLTDDGYTTEDVDKQDCNLIQQSNIILESNLSESNLSHNRNISKEHINYIVSDVSTISLTDPISSSSLIEGVINKTMQSADVEIFQATNEEEPDINARIKALIRKQTNNYYYNINQPSKTFNHNFSTINEDDELLSKNTSLALNLEDLTSLITPRSVSEPSGDIPKTQAENYKLVESCKKLANLAQRENNLENDIGILQDKLQKYISYIKKCEELLGSKPKICTLNEEIENAVTVIKNMTLKRNIAKEENQRLKMQVEEYEKKLLKCDCFRCRKLLDDIIKLEIKIKQIDTKINVQSLKGSEDSPRSYYISDEGDAVK